MSLFLERLNLAPDEEWRMPQLIQRYGVSRSTITNTFFAYGLPVKRLDGNAYCFSSRDVIWWEITQQFVSYRKKPLALPAFVQYRRALIDEIKVAKHFKNIELVKSLRREAAIHGIALSPDMNPFIVFLAIMLLLTVCTSLVH